MTDVRLVADGLRKRFGGVLAVDGFSLDAQAGEIVGLIGPNGAGKTTVFNLISGLERPDEGTLWLDGHDVTRAPAYAMSRRGVQRTFQNLRLFPGLTVRDNVVAGSLRRRRQRLGGARARADAVLSRVGFTGDREVSPAALPYAFQRRVEIARALAAEPHVLLLDEPAAGMHSTERDDLARLILDLRDQGLLIIVVEHDMSLIDRVCTRVVVMDFGRIIASGTPDEVRADASVIAAYLGVPT